MKRVLAAVMVYSKEPKAGKLLATYILLMTLTPEGRAQALDAPDYILAIEERISSRDVQMMGLYAVLGQYDYVTIVEAAGNEAMARFSLQLGVEAGMHIETMPVIPASRLDVDEEVEAASVSVPTPQASSVSEVRN